MKRLTYAEFQLFSEDVITLLVGKTPRRTRGMAMYYAFDDLVSKNPEFKPLFNYILCDVRLDPFESDVNIPRFIKAILTEDAYQQFAATGTALTL